VSRNKAGGGTISRHFLRAKAGNKRDKAKKAVYFYPNAGIQADWSALSSRSTAGHSAGTAGAKWMSMRLAEGNL
jgi:hypothetical protein